LFKDLDKNVSARLEDFADSLDEFTDAVIEGNIVRIAETAPIQILAIFGRLSVLILEAIGRLTIAVLEAIGRLTVAMLVVFGKFIWDSLVALGKWVYDFIAGIADWAAKTLDWFIKAGADFIKGLWDSIYEGITGLWDDAKEWGSKIVTSIADGIRGAIGAVVDAARSVADAITNFLGIGSPAKVGPLSRLMEWGPSLVQTYAEGIEGNVSRMNTAMGTLLGNLGTPAAQTAVTLRGTMGGGGGRALNIGSIHITAPASKDMAEEISRTLVIELNRYMRWT
jgi:hypothetical protein